MSDLVFEPKFKVYSERQTFFEKPFMAILLTLSSCPKSVEKKSAKKYFFYIVVFVFYIDDLVFEPKPHV